MFGSLVSRHLQINSQKFSNSLIVFSIYKPSIKGWEAHRTLCAGYHLVFAFFVDSKH